MASHHHHKVFIGVTAVIILILGLFLGVFLASQLQSVDLEIIDISLTLTSTILLLIVGGLMLEVKDMLQEMKRGKKR